MKNQRNILIGVLAVTVFFVATNYDHLIRGRTEIETLYPIMLAGIDSNDKGQDDFLITIVSPLTEEDATKPINVNSMSGRTAFETNRKLGMYAESDIFWGHTMYVLVGENAATENLLKYLDFFIRDHEPRLTIQPLVLYGMESQDIILDFYSQNIDINSNVERLLDNISMLSFSGEVNLLEYIALSAESRDGYLPCIKLEKEKENLIIEHSMEEANLDKSDSVMHIDGYALIKDGRVVDYLFKEEGRGLNWMINKIESGVIVVQHDGIEYNLEITESQSDIKPIIEDGQLRAELNIYIETMLTEIDKQDLTLTEDVYKILSEKAGEVIESEVEEVIKKLQKLNIDIIGLGDKFNRKYPVKWQKEYKDKWEKLFPNTNVTITIDSVVFGSGKFTDSIFVKED